MNHTKKPGEGKSPGSMRNQHIGIIPHYQEYEKNVLGCILQYGELIKEVNELEPEDFYETRDQILFNAMVRMDTEGIPIDVLSITQYLKDKRSYEEIGGFPYLDYLIQIAITPANIGHQIGKVREASQRQKLWKQAHILAEAIEKGADEETIRKHQDSIYETSNHTSFKLSNFSLQDSDLKNDNKKDVIENCVKEGSLNLLAGRWGSGKSILSLSFGKKSLSNGCPVIYIDADMPLQVVNERLEKSDLKPRLNIDLFYLHRSKCPIKISNKIWHQFLASMKSKKHHLVVLNNLKDLIMPGVNINVDSDVMTVMDEVKKLRDYGHTVLLLHHWGREGSVDNPFKNNYSIGDAVDVGYSIQNEDGVFVLPCFKDRIPVSTSLAFEVLDNFELVQVETPEKKQFINDRKHILETMQKLEAQKVEINQKNIIEDLKGIISKDKIRALLRQEVGKSWSVSQGNKRTLVYEILKF